MKNVDDNWTQQLKMKQFDLCWADPSAFTSKTPKRSFGIIGKGLNGSSHASY